MLTRFDASDDELIDQLSDLIQQRTNLYDDDADDLALDLLDIIRAADVS